MKSKQKKLVSVLLVFAIVLALTSHFTPHAFAATKTTVLNGSAQHATVAKSTVNTIRRQSNVSTQTIYHVQGKSDTRSMAGTYYFSSQMTIVSPLYTSAFAEHSSYWGLEDNKQVGAKAGLYCIIASDEPTGTYKVYPIWEGYSLRQEAYTSDSNGTTVHQNRYIAYVPHRSSEVKDTYYSR